uniref:ANK_REP_REGION domain-containing protein n=1 Tax=Trichobilharzia regenti TaxID=157069 RepID=A0AA85IPW1_TRIRE|nr:unnamed protein product [Trichobilharzia regenti]
MRKFFSKLQKGKLSRENSPSASSLGSHDSLHNVSNGNVRSVWSYVVNEKDLPKLHKAVWKEDIKKVRNLVRREPMVGDKYNRTPLHYACFKGNEDIVRELLEFNAKVNVVDNNFQTPLMKAIEGGFCQCIKLLMDYRADLTVQDSEGNAAIHQAINSSSPEIVSLLIKAGVSINTHNKEGKTGLHLAVERQDVKMVSHLLNNGAEVNCVDKNGRSALMLACLQGNSKITEILMSHGAYASLKDKKGHTPMEVALQRGHLECLQIMSTMAKNNADTKTPSLIDDSDESSEKSYEIINSLNGNLDDDETEDEGAVKSKEHIVVDKPPVPPNFTSSESRESHSARRSTANSHVMEVERESGDNISSVNSFSDDRYLESHKSEGLINTDVSQREHSQTTEMKDCLHKEQTATEIISDDFLEENALESMEIQEPIIWSPRSLKDVQLPIHDHVNSGPQIKYLDPLLDSLSVNSANAKIPLKSEVVKFESHQNTSSALSTSPATGRFEKYSSSSEINSIMPMEFYSEKIQSSSVYCKCKENKNEVGMGELETHVNRSNELLVNEPENDRENLFSMHNTEEKEINSWNSDTESESLDRMAQIEAVINKKIQEYAKVSFLSRSTGPSTTSPQQNQGDALPSLDKNKLELKNIPCSENNMRWDQSDWDSESSTGISSIEVKVNDQVKAFLLSPNHKMSHNGDYCLENRLTNGYSINSTNKVPHPSINQEQSNAPPEEVTYTDKLKEINWDSSSDNDSSIKNIPLVNDLSNGVIHLINNKTPKKLNISPPSDMSMNKKSSVYLESHHLTNEMELQSNPKSDTQMKPSEDATDFGKQNGKLNTHDYGEPHSPLSSAGKIINSDSSDDTSTYDEVDSLSPITEEEEDGSEMLKEKRKVINKGHTVQCITQPSTDERKYNTEPNVLLPTSEIDAVQRFEDTEPIRAVPCIEHSSDNSRIHESNDKIQCLSRSKVMNGTEHTQQIPYNSVTENSEVKNNPLSITLEQHLSTMNGIPTLTDHYVMMSKNQKSTQPLKSDQTFDYFELNSMGRLNSEASDSLESISIQNGEAAVCGLNGGSKDNQSIMSFEKSSPNFKSSSPRETSTRSTRSSDKQFLNLQPLVVENRRRVLCTSVVVDPDSKFTSKGATLDTTVEDTDSISLDTNLEPNCHLDELHQTKSPEKDKTLYSVHKSELPNQMDSNERSDIDSKSSRLNDTNKLVVHFNQDENLLNKSKLGNQIDFHQIRPTQIGEWKEEKLERFLNKCTSVISQEYDSKKTEPQINSSMCSVEKLRAQLLQALQALQNEHNAYEELEAARDACEARIREMNLQNMNLLSNTCDEQKSNNSVITNEIAMNMELRNQLERLKFELTMKQEKSEHLERELKNMNECYSKLNENLIKTENEKDDLESQVGQLMRRLEILQSDNMKINEINTRLKENVAEYSNAQDRFKKMKENLFYHRRLLETQQATLNNGLKHVRLRVDDIKTVIGDMKQWCKLNSRDANDETKNNPVKCDASQMVNLTVDYTEKNEMLEQTLDKKLQEIDYLTDVHQKLIACYDTVHKKLEKYLYNERLIYNNLTKLSENYDINVNNSNNRTVSDVLVPPPITNSVLYQLTSLLRIMGANQESANDLTIHLDSIKSNGKIPSTESVQQNHIQEVTLEEITSLAGKLASTEKSLYEIRKEYENCVTELKRNDAQLSSSELIINQLTNELNQYKELKETRESQFNQLSTSTQTECADSQALPSIKLDERNPLIKELLSRLEQAEQKVSQLANLNPMNSLKSSGENDKSLQTDSYEIKDQCNKQNTVKVTKPLEIKASAPRELKSDDEVENVSPHIIDQISTLRQRISELESDRERLCKENERLSDRTEKQRRFTEKLTNHLCQSTLTQQTQQPQIIPPQPPIQQLPTLGYSMYTQPTILLPQPVCNVTQHGLQSPHVIPLCAWNGTDSVSTHHADALNEDSTQQHHTNIHSPLLKTQNPTTLSTPEQISDQNIRQAHMPSSWSLDQEGDFDALQETQVGNLLTEQQLRNTDLIKDSKLVEKRHVIDRIRHETFLQLKPELERSISLHMGDNSCDSMEFHRTHFDSDYKQIGRSFQSSMWRTRPSRENHTTSLILLNAERSLKNMERRRRFLPNPDYRADKYLVALKNKYIIQ